MPIKPNPGRRLRKGIIDFFFDKSVPNFAKSFGCTETTVYNMINNFLPKHYDDLAAYGINRTYLETGKSTKYRTSGNGKRKYKFELYLEKREKEQRVSNKKQAEDEMATDISDELAGTSTENPKPEPETKPAKKKTTRKKTTKKKTTRKKAAKKKVAGKPTDGLTRAARKKPKKPNLRQKSLFSLTNFPKVTISVAEDGRWKCEWCDLIYHFDKMEQASKWLETSVEPAREAYNS